MYIEIFVSILLLLLFIVLVKRWINKEVERRIQQEQLLFQQNRLIAMGEMMSNVAHHWKQPLNTVALLVMNIQKNYQANKLTNEYLEEKVEDIEETIEKMSQTLEDFTYYLTPSANKELFCVNQSMKTAIKLLSHDLQKNRITVEFHAQNAYNCMGQKNELTQVFIAILNNARDALLKEEEVQNKKITVTLTEVEQQIHITIQDNGKGIASELLDKVFDPYFTTAHKTQGKGLALYMAKVLIIERFNGDITVRNSSGALFEITIKK